MENIFLKNYIKCICFKQKIKNNISTFINDEEGAGVIEVVLILVVLIGLVLVFKDKIGELLNGIFVNINKSANEIYN